MKGHPCMHFEHLTVICGYTYLGGQLEKSTVLIYALR